MNTLDEILDLFEKNPSTKLFPEKDRVFRRSHITAFYTFVVRAVSKHLSLEAYAVGISTTAPEIRLRGKIGGDKFRCYHTSAGDIARTVCFEISRLYMEKHVVGNDFMMDIVGYVSPALEADMLNLSIIARKNIHGVQQAHEKVAKKRDTVRTQKKIAATGKVNEALKQYPFTLEELTTIWEGHQVRVVMES
jgi:hypothetical protein